MTSFHQLGLISDTTVIEVYPCYLLVDQYVQKRLYYRQLLRREVDRKIDGSEDKVHECQN